MRLLLRNFKSCRARCNYMTHSCKRKVFSGTAVKRSKHIHGWSLCLCLFNKHHEKAYCQQSAGKPDRADGKNVCQQRAKPGAEREQADHAEIRQRLVQDRDIARVEIRAQRLGAAAHVADAHGACVGVAAHLSEGLHLHGAHKGNDGVGESINRLRQKADGEKQDYLGQNYELPPVYTLHVFIMPVDALGNENTEHKGQHRNKISSAVRPFSVEEICAQQDDVARLRVCENLTAAKIGVRILQTAGQDYKHGREHGFGHLAAYALGVHEANSPSPEKTASIIRPAFPFVNFLVALF